MTTLRIDTLVWAVLLAVLVWCGVGTVRAGDATYGEVAAVKSGNVVAFKHDSGTFEVLLAGVEAPNVRAFDEQARRYIETKSAGKLVQFRLDGRNARGQMVGRIHIDDGAGRVHDLGVELVRQGLATPVRTYRGYKYDELNTAMKEARARKAGMWSAPQR